MERDGIYIRELRQEEASEARDIVISGIKQMATYRRALNGFFQPIGWFIMGLLLVGCYLLTSSLFVSVVLATVLTLHSILGLLNFFLWISINFEPDLQDLYSWYKDGGKFWVAVCGGKVVGTVALQRTSETEAELKRMGVVPNYRRKGLATRMVKHFEEYCRSEGIERIFLYTGDVQPEVKHLYLKCGFTITKKDKYGTISFEKLI